MNTIYQANYNQDIDMCMDLKSDNAKQSKMSYEPMLEENPSRFVLFPIKYHDIWEMYKKQVASFWTTEEIDLYQDLNDWEKLNDNERHFIKYVLAFFSSSDGIVNENLAQKFCTEIQVPEARCFYGFQIAMENIHSETYSLLIDTFIKDEKEKNFLFNASQNIDVIKKRRIGQSNGLTPVTIFQKELLLLLQWKEFSFLDRFALSTGSKRGVLCQGLLSAMN